VGSLGIPVETAKTLMAVIVIAFAATSLDTGARIQRLVIAELGDHFRLKFLTNRFVAGGLGIGAALTLAVTQGGGTGGLALWPLFGTTNQLVASVTLLIVSIWLQRRGRAIVYTVVPMLAVGAASAWAMTHNLLHYYENFDTLWLLALSGTLILALDIWIMLEGIRMLAMERGRVPRASAEAPF
jgi:carbon starvation protein